MYRGAMRSILSELFRQGRIRIEQELILQEPKTKLLAGALSSRNLTDVLIVTEDWQENLVLAARNLPNVDVVAAEDIDPISLIAFDNLLISEGAIRRIEERLA